MSIEDPQGVVRRAVYLSAVDSADQTFDDPDTSQVIDFDTLLESQNITNLGSGEFEIKDTGAYLIGCSVQVTKTLNGNMNYTIWLQRDIGAGFVSVPFSSTENELTGVGLIAGQSKNVVYVFELELEHGDKIRLQNAVSDTDVSLMAFSPTIGPFVPSARIRITKTGRL